MKSIPILLALVFVCGIARSQSSITPTDIERLRREAANKLWEVSSYRHTSFEGTGKSAEDLETSYKSVTDLLTQENRYHTITEERNGAAVKRTETITIGPTVYVKTGSSPWRLQRQETGGSGVGTGSGTGTDAASDVEDSGEDLGIEKNASGANIHHYRITYKITFHEKSGDIVDRSTFDCWFDTLGRLVKSEDVDFRHFAPAYSIKREEYDFDGKIAIEKPIK